MIGYFVAGLVAGLTIGILGSANWWQARWIRYLEEKHSVHVPVPGRPAGHVTLPEASPEEQAARLGMAEAVDKLADEYLRMAREINKPLDREEALQMARRDMMLDSPGGALA